MPYCSRCGAMTNAADAHCTACGAPTLAYGSPAVAPVGYAAPPAHLGPPINQGTAIAALLLNILVWPGLGSIIAGQSVGWIQGFLTLFGLVLIVTIVGIVVGIPLMIAMWVWGIVTGVQLLQRAGAQQQARDAMPRGPA